MKQSSTRDSDNPLDVGYSPDGYALITARRILREATKRRCYQVTESQSGSDGLIRRTARINLSQTRLEKISRDMRLNSGRVKAFLDYCFRENLSLDDFQN